MGYCFKKGLAVYKPYFFRIEQLKIRLLHTYVVSGFRHMAHTVPISRNLFALNFRNSNLSGLSKKFLVGKQGLIPLFSCWRVAKPLSTVKSYYVKGVTVFPADKIELA